MSSRRRWMAFALWTAVVFVAAPFANDIQAWISDQLGPQALRLALSLLLLALTAGFAVRLVRRRDGSAPVPPEGGKRYIMLERASGATAIGGRLAWLLGLAVLAFALMWRLRVEAEPVHLALYAILGGFAFRALAVRHRDGGVYLAAAALTAIVGTVDEVNQWLLPSRFWDLADIGLNVSAGVMVQLVIWKVVRPAGVAVGFGARSLRIAARLAACETLLLVLCVSNTPVRIEWYATRVPGLGYLGQGLSTMMNEYGHLYVDPEIGRFRSRLSPEELPAFDRRYGAEVAKVLDRFGEAGYATLQRENPPSRAPFVYEAVGHLFYRQRLTGRARKKAAHLSPSGGTADPAQSARLATIAYRENLILERYFSHSLASSSAVLRPGARQWLEGLHQPHAEFESKASEWLLTGFSEAQARWFLLAILTGLMVAERACSRRLGTEPRGE